MLQKGTNDGRLQKFGSQNNLQDSEQCSSGKN